MALVLDRNILMVFTLLMKNQTAKLSPHAQVRVALGFIK